MRIIHVAAVKGIAGSEGHLLRLLPGLRSAGLDAQMVVLGPAQGTVSFVEELRAREIPVTWISLKGHVAPSLVWRLRDHFRAVRPNIVHTHLIHGDLYGTLAARMAGVPRVVSSRHNIDKFRWLLPVRMVSRMLWRMTDRGIAISDAVRKFAQIVEHARPGQVQTIYYGLEARPADPLATQRREIRHREWQIEPGGPVVGSICRLIEQKGIGYALEAFARIRQCIPSAHYVIAGDGRLRCALVEQARSLGLEGCTHFLGWQNHPDDLYDCFDVFLSPSLWEGFGLVLLEAMSHRLPIVTTNTSAMPEIVVEGETGYLVPPADSEALVEPLTRLLTERNLARRMGEAGRMRLETVFSVEKMVSETIRFYRSVVESPST